jgi:threonine dehydrogenase-like Zn-dependent dehydrogenase
VLQIRIVVDLPIVVTYIDGDFEGVIEAIRTGKLLPKGMITKVIRPDQVAEEGFKALTDDKDNQVKILVDMTKSIGK